MKRFRMILMAALLAGCLLSGAQADEKKKEFKSKTPKKTKKTKTDPGFDLDEFFDLAIARGGQNGKNDK